MSPPMVAVLLPVGGVARVQGRPVSVTVPYFNSGTASMLNVWAIGGDIAHWVRVVFNGAAEGEWFATLELPLTDWQGEKIGSNAVHVFAERIEQ